MQRLPITSACLLSMILLGITSGTLLATPPLATKPRLIHRPIPGTAGKDTSAPSKARPPVQPTQPRRVVATPVPGGETGADETRILQIIRQGTPGVPPTPGPAQATTEGGHVTQLRNQETETPMSSGRVRILTPAEAEALAAKSH